MKVRRIGILTLAAVLALTAAAGVRAQDEATDLSPGNSVETQTDPWAEYPGREAERPALPPAGGGVISVAFTSIVTNLIFDEDGAPQDSDGDYSLLVTELSVEYGITRWWALSAGFPYVSGDIQGVTGGGGGDISAGSRVALYSNPNFDISLGLSVSFPTGDSSYHFETVNGRLVLNNIRTGDPGLNYYPRLETRFKSGPWALRLAYQAIYTGPGTVNFTYSGTGVSNLGVLLGDDTQVVDPGDGYRVSAGLLYQITDQWVTGVFGQYENISETLVSGHGLNDDKSLVLVQPRLMFQLQREFEVELRCGWAAAGNNAPAGFEWVLAATSRF